MLDRMRRHKNWLKWSLALVCLAFVIFYIPDFLRGNGAELIGEVAQYEDKYKPCYMRGPAGIIVALAEELF